MSHNVVSIEEMDRQIATATAPLVPLIAIVEQILTMHWDMKACECWVCEAGRKAGCRPRDEYLEWRESGLGLVEVQRGNR